jgi:hypothetical protein
MVQMCRELGWSPRRQSPHGGQLLGLALAAGLQLGGTETYPLVFQPFGGFGDDARVVDGQISPTEIPGVGVESKAELYETVLAPLVSQ